MGCGPFSGRNISGRESYRQDSRNPNPFLFEIKHTHTKLVILLSLL